MTRKTITTSHTVVACDVCGRRLLRGERAEVFLAGGSRRMVCELCTARAAHEGWLREGLDDVGVRRNGGRGARSPLARLRQRREAALARAAEEADRVEATREQERRGLQRRGLRSRPEGEGGQQGEEAARPPEPRQVHAVPTNADLKMARAVEVFNAGAHLRTVTGVARSLGAPEVSVLPSRTEGTVVSIVVAWELTWYRFEVDLGNEAAGVRIAQQGSELSELDEADRRANAALGADGTLALVS